MIGTIRHTLTGVTASIAYVAPFASTQWSRRYSCGLEQPNYPMPAIELAVLMTADYVAIAEPDYFEGELMEFIIVAEFEKD